MKGKYHIISCLCVVCMIWMTACQKEEVDTYDVTCTGLNIWVGTSVSVYDSIAYNYSYAYEDGSVEFYAQVYGVPVDYDRTFTLEAYGDHYELVAPTIRKEVYTIPAGKVSGVFEVHFNTQALPFPDLFTETDGKVRFRVAINDDFMGGAENMQSFTVILRNRLAKPSNWDTANYPQVALNQYFGMYSRVKYQFMIEVLGLVDFTISYFASTAIDESTNLISPAYAVYLQQLMQKSLKEYNNSHDVPLTDENGEPVTFDY